MADIQQKPETMMVRLRKMLGDETVQSQLKSALAENAGAFATSILEVVYGSKDLQACEPREIIMECMKGATLNLPINKNLGFADIIPRKKKGVVHPQFQIGYKGYIQLAQRTGQFRFLNVGIIYEGMQIEEDILTGSVAIMGKKKSDCAHGYFCHMELLNGYQKTLHMSKEEVIAHAKKYSASWGNPDSAWTTNFDAMALKTTIRLLAKFFPMSIKMAVAIAQDQGEELADEMNEQANTGEVIDIQTGKITETPKAEEGQKAEEPAKADTPGPGW